ncbi:DUF3352 domain-containing protein [Nocardioides sp. KIGAM211]|uniref:DUF3352 domain-containing protein n=1 Tax=Nocardioides luti TaxID=2761101 RepID=A0A7X0RDL0_9ACTN|nr:DUF3352 domain-containing protein [Nocardioides luti]MBB6626326.1 DUF3352 domain-containing protein [Nocardioides luti]
MSSTTPPTGSGPTGSGPVGPGPTGPPPTGPGQPEYLTQGGGAPWQPGAEPRTGGGGRKALIGGGALVGLALVGGGIWAATSFFGSGPQPAEALPDTTLGYVSVDLDPSGGQKIEAIRTLRKFPAFKDQIGLDTEDDLREKIFEQVQEGDACPDLDYADDIEPWLGDRAAVAAVDTGQEQPVPVFVVQVKDADQADAGLKKIQACAGGGDDSVGGSSDSAGTGTGGWAIEGDWAVVAETEEIAQGVADDAADASLADDEDYRKWTDEVGDAGIVNMYAAPAAGAFLAENLGGLGMLTGASSMSSCAASADGETACDDTGSSTAAPSQVTDALKDFKGAAATIRFADGALELEVAGDPGFQQTGLYASDQGDDVLATLPEDTAAALGVGLQDGWFGEALDQVASYSGGETSADELLAQLSEQSGLDLPDDAETLAGESFAVGISSDFDPEAFANGSGLSELPIAAKVKGDPAAIDDVLDKVRPQLGADEQGTLDLDADGDVAAIGPNADYRAKVLADGGLGDSEVFQDVVPDADRASAILFVNFDAGDGWLVNLVGDDQEVADNLEPLSGFGISSWLEDDAAHALVRITTN